MNTIAQQAWLVQLVYTHFLTQDFNPYPANNLCLVNGICLLHLLHILKCTLDYFYHASQHNEPRLEVIKLFSYSTQLSTKFILLINVKIPTIVGILTFISMINTISERLKARHFFICRYFSFYEQLKFHAQFSRA